MSCGVDFKHGSDLALLWLWYRPEATALIGFLAWETPYASGCVPKKMKERKKRKKKERNKETTKAQHNKDDDDDIRPTLNYLIINFLKTGVKGRI